LLLFIAARKDVSRFQRLIQGRAYFEMPEMSPQRKKPMDSQSKHCSILLDVASVGWAFAFDDAGLG
jgi:hypothetical protein